MVKAWLTGLLALSGVFILSARDMTTYRVGDLAETDITTPVALDVIDPVSTALMRETEKLKTPAIFRDFSHANTNALAKNFTAAFTATRVSFLNDVREKFHAATLDEVAISSPEFGNLLTTFNIKNKTLPVPVELEASWARGESGLDVQNKWLAALLQALHQPIRSTDQPDGFVFGAIVRLVPVSGPDETPVLDVSPGMLIPASTLKTLAQVQAQFLGQFSESEQAEALALAQFLQPTCVPDVALTQQLRDSAVHSLAALDHYDAGELIVRRGDSVDVKAKVALEQLHEKLIPVELNFRLNVEQERAQQQSQQVRDATASLQKQVAAAQNQTLQERGRNQWLMTALIVLALVTVAAFWQARVQRRRGTSLALARPTDLQLPGVQSDIAVHLAQAVKEALLQELATQRVELLQAQQNAAGELAKLVKRLDELQAPLQERLGFHETQVKKLGNEEVTYMVPPPADTSAGEAEHKNGNGSSSSANGGGPDSGISDLLAEGQSLLNANKLDAALKCFDAVLELEPNHAEALVKKGGVLERMWHLDEAIACYDRAIDVDNSMTIAYLHKGGLFNRMARYEEAMQCYEKALQTQTKNPA